MGVDTPPSDETILALIRGHSGPLEPGALISKLLAADHEIANIIEALQRAIERGRITLDSEGMVVAMKDLAVAA